MKHAPTKQQLHATKQENWNWNSSFSFNFATISICFVQATRFSIYISTTLKKPKVIQSKRFSKCIMTQLKCKKKLTSESCGCALIASEMVLKLDGSKFLLNCWVCVCRNCCSYCCSVVCWWLNWFTCDCWTELPAPKSTKITQQSDKHFKIANNVFVAFILLAFSIFIFSLSNFALLLYLFFLFFFQARVLFF